MPAQKKVAIIIYTLYNHIGRMAESVKSGVDAQGFESKIFQVPETLPKEVLKAMHAPEKPPYEIATRDTLSGYDAFLFGIPTRFGNMPAQFKTFWDTTGGLWVNGGLYHKPFGVFVSTGTGGGNESTVMNNLSSFIHHGMVFVPLGYAKVFPELTNLNEVHGGSPWGSGTFAGADGSRNPTELELKIAKLHGTEFGKYLKGE
ncbi:flavodoxin-like fold protein [Brettanomyces nanus]|uniref:Flavodoxin-like fold protein n=1 Tax=Eeniella nana TaxID=13502 RepID=A0A875S4U1_EENNA|nr:flavodoxin-like fold protein [Brettanomyces nanus]QPG75933.1 flavodoxin-like fold protein [Brettanomyces nanus]